MKNISKKAGKRQPKIKTEMNRKGLTVHAELLPELTFTERLLFRERIHEAVDKERGSKEIESHTFIISIMTIILEERNE